MRVLLTGYTSRHIGSDRLQYHYATSSTYLKEILVACGFEVEQRAVIPGEKLTGKYDGAIVGVCPPNALTAIYWPGAAWTLSQLGQRSLIYYDDWGVIHTASGTRTWLTTWDRRLKFFQGDQKPVDGKYEFKTGTKTQWSFNDRVKKTLQGTLQSFLEPELPWPALACLFEWGRADVLEKLMLPAKTIGYDPSAFITLPTVKAPVKKEKKWILATLQDHSKWLKERALTWPVERMGNRRKDELGFIPEDDVVQKYADSWGVLAPKYPANIRGWFRTRFVFAAYAKSVTVCDISEAQHMDDSFQVPGRQVEKFSEKELLDLASHQATWLKSQMWSKDRAIETVRKAVLSRVKK